MFDFLKAGPELVAVDHDPEVSRTREPLLSARAQLDALEAEEQQLIRLVTGKESRYTDEHMDEALRRLSIQKGTQTGWFLPEAQEARDTVKRLTVTYQKAVAAAKQRLADAGMAKIAALTGHLAEVLKTAQSVAIEIQSVRDQMGQGGADSIEHPCSALLPHGLVEYQLRIARERGWC